MIELFSDYITELFSNYIIELFSNIGKMMKWPRAQASLASSADAEPQVKGPFPGRVMGPEAHGTPCVETWPGVGVPVPSTMCLEIC